MAGSKYSVLPLVADHYGTFIDARTSKRRGLDYLTFLGVPLALGVVLAIFDVRLGGLTAVLTGLAALTGLLFGFVIWIFGLRVQVAADPRVEKLSAAPAQLDDLFSNAIYATLTGLVTVGTTVAAVSTQHGDHANCWWSAVVLMLALHLLLTLGMCLKRLHSAFELLTM